MAQKTKKTILTIGVLLLFWLPLTSVSIAATNCNDSKLTPAQRTSCQACNSSGSTPSGCLQNNVVTKDINIVVDFLSGVVGVVVVGAIILGGIQYSAAGDNPQAVSAAKKRITDGLLALVAFILTFAFLQWLIPGGVFG